MYLKPKHFLLLSLVTLLFIPNGFCLAREFESPLPGLAEGAKLPEYLKYIFNLGMGIAGVLALITLVIGGFRYITSVGNPGVISDAKKRIFGGIFGLILLLSSYLILTTINPELKVLQVRENIISIPGIYLTGTENGEPIQESCPPMLSSTSRIKPPFNKIKWNCSTSSDDDYPYWVFTYNDENFEGIKNYWALTCNTSISLQGVNSFIIKRVQPGVYFFPDQNCADDAPPTVYTSSIPSFNKFDQKVKSIRVVNGPDEKKGPFYGVILHSLEDYRSYWGVSNPSAVFKHACDFNFLNCKNWTTRSTCYNIDLDKTRSVTIYKWIGYNENGDVASAGDGVTLYTRPNWRGGSKLYKDEWIREAGYSNLVLADHGPLEWPSDVPEEEKNKCNFFSEECLKSIEISGDYLVMPWRNAPGARLQIFPISGRLASTTEYGYTGYDIDKGPIDLTLEWVYQYHNDIVDVLIIPLAEKLE